MKKRIAFERITLGMIPLMALFASTITSFADEGVLDKFAKLMKANDAMAWGVLGPILIISATIILVLGILGIVAALGYIGWHGLLQFFGKGKVGKEELKRFATGLIIGLLITGGGWLSFIKLWDRVVITPAEQIFQEKN
ncbi:hypothetical protein [Geosporobacter ferrireducens]|uniref:Uncharacterized protein n=1 Tax=Geosporobacter ferrireducens TaxID=1424294 RepID=A0A1D8GBV9_9FIRM|nr:hypothetical protein [Geosporobacter ferrireducens]AOT68360.1 hypothetical protein Gferi_01370 [Geosporobacter ferrireducens]